MLKLTRRQGESIMIGDNIKIVVVETRSDRAIIGIDAPDDVKIARGELVETEKKEQSSDVQKHKKISVDRR